LAQKHLAYAGQADPDDGGTATALERVRADATAAKAAPASVSAAGAEPAQAEPRAAGDGAAPDDVMLPTIAGAGGLAFSFDEGARSPVQEAVFSGLDGGADGLLLVDANGLRLGGGLRNPDGQDVADSVAALLAGVSKEAARTTRLLALGDWRGLAVECGDGNLFLSAPSDSTLLLTVRGLDVPMGRVARFAERASAAARTWLERAE
jgi:predicted regulator of Ras-like GTPase activity (Roadblock/LC7/MglB family)